MSARLSAHVSQCSKLSRSVSQFVLTGTGGQELVKAFEGLVDKKKGKWSRLGRKQSGEWWTTRKYCAKRYAGIELLTNY